MFVMVKNIHILPWPSSVSDKENPNHYFYILDGFSVRILHYISLPLILVIIVECRISSPPGRSGNLNDVHGRPDGELLVGMTMCNAC